MCSKIMLRVMQRGSTLRLLLSFCRVCRHILSFILKPFPNSISLPPIAARIHVHPLQLSTLNPPAPLLL
jgi:hypothetical protein